MSSKSIALTKALNSFWYLDVKSSFLTGQVPICCLMTSRCSLKFGQWNSRWSIDWYSSPQLHVASSVGWNRCRYAFVIPWPVSTAVIFGVSFILDRTVCWIVGKYCLVAAALLLVVHSSCHLCMASSSASLYIVLLGILSKSHFMSAFLAASFAILSCLLCCCVLCR